VSADVALAERLTAPLPGVSLADLDRAAALRTRVDAKYVLRADEVEALWGLLVGFRVLDIDGLRCFGYETVYFDTADLRCFHAHRQGRRRRFKVRTRRYLDADLCMLEVKRLGGRGDTVKHRRPHDLDAHGRLPREACAFVGDTLRECYGLDFREALSPAVVTRYRRVTLLAPDAEERVTLDFGLRLACGGREHGLPDGQVFVETKGRRGHCVADRALRALRVRPLPSASKYCVGLLLARPDLPVGPFRRAVRLYSPSAAGTGDV
jgi:hypothetical protein